MRDKTIVKSYVYLLTAILLWSTAEVVTRMVVGAITPMQLAFVRWVLGGMCMAVFLPFELRAKSLSPDRRTLVISPGLSILGVRAGFCLGLVAMVTDLAAIGHSATTNAESR